MSEFSNQVEEILTLITSNSKAVKSLGYSTLLHLQEQSTQHPSAIQALSQHLSHLLLSTISDISDEDEEISCQALKCLGFVIYHPSLVVDISEDVAHLVVDPLVKLITTTKTKAICNLGVWCISVQQFNASFLAPHFHSILRAVIHALDNPTGSLSTTFEATQAVIKLVAQLGEKMRETSNIWAPVIYRRLLSGDKRERDMTERCLLKIRSIIFPPPLALSKALVTDVKRTLLSEMKEVLQDHGRKVHTIQAWGWYIRLMGSHALKNRQLVNEMLKVPEQTFSDSDPQVQIASQVAWEGLIDALIHPELEASGAQMDLGHNDQQRSSMTLYNYEKTAEGLPKSLRLIMTPLVGVMSSKCDISVRSSCLNTWCYLLHKLDFSVNHPSVVKTVVEPIFEAVFQKGTDDKSLWLWNFCIDLLDDSITSNNSDKVYESSQQVSCRSSSKVSSLGPNKGAQNNINDYPIKWLPWDLSKLDFHLKMIHLLISQGSETTLTPECRSLACNAALRAFRSMLKGIRNELKKSSTSYSEIMLCLNAILSLTKELCEDATLKDFNDLLCTSLHFIEVIIEELEPSLLVSPLYRVALDFRYINDLQLTIDIEYPEVPEIRSIKCMDMVSPTIFLTVLYLCMAALSISNASQVEIIQRGMKKHLKFLLSSYNPLDNLYAIISILYMHKEFAWLKIWGMIANDLKEHINGVKDTPSLKIEMNGDGYAAVCWFLSYPFVVCCYSQKLLATSSSDVSSVLSQVELQNIVEIWKSLCGSVKCSTQPDCPTMTDFPEELCGILNKVLTDKSSSHDGGSESCIKENNRNQILQHLFGEVVVYLLNHILIFNEEGLESECPSGSIKNSLEFIARYLRLPPNNMACDSQDDQPVTSRVFSALAHFVGCLRLKHHILLLLEIFSDPLVQWLSTCATMHEMQKGSISYQLQLLWTEILDSLERSQPPIVFDSSFLKVQAPVLEKTLNYPNSAISEPTITFWNHTYGNRIKLDYPQSLLPVLDKLSRNERVNIHKGSPPLWVTSNSREKRSAPSRYRVAAKHNSISKRVELTEDKGNAFEKTVRPVPGSKRKKLELTEHQKEVRRAQQGRERDCSGHGPGIRTYTSVDFSQGNDDSQESQEIRNPEAILELLRKAP